MHSTFSRRQALPVLAALTLLTATAFPSLARLDNFDIREASKVEPETLGHLKWNAARRARLTQAATAMAAAQTALAARIPGLAIERYAPMGIPEIVDGTRGGLLTPPSTESPESATRRFLSENAALYGLTPEQATNLRTVAAYTNPAGNLSWVGLRQEVNGIPVFQGEVQAAVTRDGAVARLTGRLAPALEADSLTAQPTLTMPEAAALAVSGIGSPAIPAGFHVTSRSPDGLSAILSPGPLLEAVRAELVYFPLGRGAAALAYAMTLWQSQDAAYYVVVDATDGSLLWRKCIVHDLSQTASYSVYDSDSPAPFSPTSSLPGSGTQARNVSRTTVTLSSELPAYDDLGWMTDNTNITTGNNVDAGLDIDGVDGIDANGRASGSPTRVFNFSYAPGVDSPALPNYRMGSVTNLFFWSNRYHDRLYQLGFTEAARNFQTSNFNRGGLGGDSVRAQAQDSSGANNSNFATPADGGQPKMQMYLFSGPVPDRDGSLDADVVLHELTHGLSDRLHGNASGLTTTAAGGMGEGWSDFYARCILSTAGENPDAVYATAGYSTYKLGALGTDNYYYGIRRFPYAVKSNVGANGKPHNPLTFADIDPAQMDLSDGAYSKSPILFGSADEVHNAGELWCMALLEVRARMIKRLGFATGNQRMMQIVTDAMKLDPLNPTMISGRDSLLAADAAGYASADKADIWQGFATRGIGYDAAYSGGNVTEAFDLPNLHISDLGFSDAGGNNNGIVDPGEDVILVITLKNPLAQAATGTTASIAGNGSADYGTISPGGTFSRTIPYHVSLGTCGTVLPISVDIDSSLGPETIVVALNVGSTVLGLNQNFDSAVAPALPSGWSSTSAGAETAWVNSGTKYASAPNSVFAPDVGAVGASTLLAPAVHFTTSAGRVLFNLLYNMEGSDIGFEDGAVMEVSVDGGTFSDVLDAGCAFSKGGYNGVISTKYANPLAGRNAWSGLSGGTSSAPAFVPVVLNLPPSMAGKNMRFRWVVGTDTSTVGFGVPGVRLDDVRMETDLLCSPVNPLDMADAVTALKLAAGLLPATPALVKRLDVVTGVPAGRVEASDAVRILREVTGLDPS